ncbi:hypothetical protein JEZ13_07495 [bacterium]|nr:hypothetical protein [bacterium]
MKKFEAIVVINNVKYKRIPIKTRILSPEDDIIELMKEYVQPLYQAGDIVTLSESPVAITQGRAIPVSELKIGWLAKFLWRFVAKVPYGVGLRAPESMQCAIDETGGLRIILAAGIGAITKLFGIKGMFYRVAGMQAALIDAATTSPVPPYDKCVIKGPKNPQKVTEQILQATGIDTVIMDINDIGGSWAIGASKNIDKKLVEKIMKDNPQGQGDELTPFCIIRKE